PPGSRRGRVGDHVQRVVTSGLLSKGLVLKTSLSRVKKRKVVRSFDSRAEKTKQRDSLLSLILGNRTVMPVCSSCEVKGFSSCEASLSDSSRCAECVRSGKSYCDLQGLSAQQLRRIGDQHQKLEDALEKAEEERRALDAKVERLRKQKKMWFEKMMRAVRRGIDSVEELERVEREEAEAEQRRVEPVRPSADSPRLPVEFTADWDTLYPDVALSPSLLAEFGLLDSGSVVERRSTPEASPRGVRGP
ncbi:uncharacterized protein CTRU02_200978, partial [Colletotrichum truncatum]